MNDNDFNLEEKDIYQLLNQVKLEESEFNSMDEEIKTIQKVRIKKNFNKRIKSESRGSLTRLKVSSMAAAVGVICLIGIGTAYPAFAENIPVLNSITQTLNEKFGSHTNYAEYSQMVNKSVTDKGITVTINEALADDSKLIIGYTIKSDQKIEDLQVVGLTRFIKINGKPVAGSGSGLGNYIDDYTYIGSEEIKTTIPKDTNQFKVDVNVDDIMGIKGTWNFAFSVSKDGLTKHSTVFYPNNIIDFPDSQVTIDKVVFSPIDTAIVLSGNYKDKEHKLNQNEGDGIYGIFDYDFWLAFDDKGVELIPKGIGGGSSDSNKQTFQSGMDYQNMEIIPNYLTIIPCKFTASGGGGVSMDANGKETYFNIATKAPGEVSKTIDGVYPIELPQGKFGKLIINEIKTENDTTTVRFTAEGIAPYFQATELHVKDHNGEILTPKNYVRRINEQNPNEFTMSVAALDLNEKYSVSTTLFENVELREDLKFTIELKK